MYVFLIKRWGLKTIRSSVGIALIASTLLFVKGVKNNLYEERKNWNTMANIGIRTALSVAIATLELGMVPLFQEEQIFSAMSVTRTCMDSNAKSVHNTSVGIKED